MRRGHALSLDGHGRGRRSDLSTFGAIVMHGHTTQDVRPRAPNRQSLRDPSRAAVIKDLYGAAGTSASSAPRYRRRCLRRGHLHNSPSLSGLPKRPAKRSWNDSAAPFLVKRPRARPHAGHPARPGCPLPKASQGSGQVALQLEIVSAPLPQTMPKTQLRRVIVTRSSLVLLTWLTLWLEPEQPRDNASSICYRSPDDHNISSVSGSAFRSERRSQR